MIRSLKRLISYALIRVMGGKPGKPAVLSHIERAEATLLGFPQVETPLTHRFAPGVYMREVLLPAGTLAIGHEHKTSHFAIILSGRALVSRNGVVAEIKGPCVWQAEAGVRNIAYVYEDLRWLTIHPTDETELTKLEDQLVIKSSTWRAEHEANRLRQLAEQ